MKLVRNEGSREDVLGSYQDMLECQGHNSVERGNGKLLEKVEVIAGVKSLSI